MVGNAEIASELWYIRVPEWVIRKIENGDIDTMPDEKIIVLIYWCSRRRIFCLGSYVERRISIFQLKPWDTVLTSSYAIPGNEKQMAKND
jgi:mRNA degradation ribonuclease J1/J2